MKKGFTLIELMTVIALVLVFTALTVPAMKEFYEKEVLEREVRALENHLRIVQSRAIAGKNDSAWGIKFFEDKYILFQGESFDEKVTDYDEEVYLFSETEIEGISEIVFEKLTGKPIIKLD